jgi:group II intron reverse transcriptase/maturase
MGQKTLERLEHLRKQNSDKAWTNHDLYRLMYQEELYIVAYERIKSKPGNMTPGADEETLDGFSLGKMQEIIQAMRTEQFHFKPVRTTFIPKANGKLRKLGIPCVRDKVVQEVMHMILEAIYDSPHGAYFRETSHGFRPNRSCHTAMREFRGKWSAVNWLIEGDIQACFDEIEHHTLVAILRKKIKDERFLNLIWKLLNAGYMDLHGERKDSLIGSPQGGIVSPILANVYLHELDAFVEGLRTELEKGKEKRRNPTWRRLIKRKHRLIARKQTRTGEFKDLLKRTRDVPAMLVNDPEFIRVKYLRYADDWLIGVCGSRALAEEIKERVKCFLKDHLHLTLSEEKTCITNTRTEEAFFLGTILKIGNGGNAKLTRQTSRTGKTFKRRTTGSETVMKAPLPRLMKRLAQRGFCTNEGKATPKPGWAFLDEDQIVSLYSGVNRGIQNYYRFVDNWEQVRRVQHTLRFSLAKTLAQKFKITVAKVFQRYGKEFTIVVRGTGGKEDRKVSFYLNHNWAKQREAFQGGEYPDIDLVRTAIRMRTRSKLGKPCCICGETAGQVVMHHVRHVRKLSDKREATGFNRILRAINRKQIPVCPPCHGNIHRGAYDGLKLSELAYIPR